MFRAIGTVIVLFAFVHIFGAAFAAAERAFVATFGALEAAALLATDEMQNAQQRTR
jgi:hypothetical protein